MSTLKELAREYRKTAARLALRLEELEADGAADQMRLRCVRETLRDIREVQRLLDGYYDVPRSEGISAAGWIAGKYSDD